MRFLSIFKYCLTPSRAFLAGTARQGYEKEKDKRMTVSLCQDERLKTRSMMKVR